MLEVHRMKPPRNPALAELAFCLSGRNPRIHILDPCTLISQHFQQQLQWLWFLGLHHRVTILLFKTVLQIIIGEREGCWIPRFGIFTGILALIQHAGIGALCGIQCWQGIDWIGVLAAGASRVHCTCVNLLSVQGKHQHKNWWISAPIYHLGWFEMFSKVRDCLGDKSVAAVEFAPFRGSHSTWSLTWDENLQPVNMC